MSRKNRDSAAQTPDGSADAQCNPAAGTDVGQNEAVGMNAPEVDASPTNPVGEPSVKPIDPGFMDEPVGGFKAYGEPLNTDEGVAEFNELDAMEELLSTESKYGSLPHPDIFNAYPPEVQRKIMEWTDRDVKARRDDESRRKDELVRASIERNRRKQVLPAIIIIVAVLCGAIVGFITRNPWFTVAFLIVPIAVIVAVFVSDNIQNTRGDRYRKPPQK